MNDPAGTRGFSGASGSGVVLGPVHLVVPTADAMRALGERLASVLRAGDLVVLAGDLGAGKTTLTQGIGAGLAVRGDITSPTFVIARVHPSTVGGPALAHVDAYRLSSLVEIDDLDLDASVDASVTVVEWGTGLVEALVDSRLEVRLHRATGAGSAARGGDPPALGGDQPALGGDQPALGGEDAEARRVEVTGHGARWAGVSLPLGAD